MVEAGDDEHLRSGQAECRGVVGTGELVEAGVLSRQRRDGIEYPIWSAVHGLAVLTGPGPLRDVPEATRHHLEELTFTFIGEGLT